jgi:SAM-dependent methyltransferase
MDWDSFYQRDVPPPWSIGAPQPELAALIADGKVRSDVLDAGCGHAELSLELARQGYHVVGLDSSLTAVSAAATAAAEHGLTSASFAQADITDFGGYDDRFSTVIDSGLFHSLPVERRSDYLRCIARAAAPGAALYILSFSAEIGGGANQAGPSGVTEDELREAVSAHWVVDDVRPAVLYGNATALPEGVDAPDLSRFVDGDRMRMPGFLLSAHKAA